MQQPACGNCVRRKNICPGARTLTEPVFKNTFSKGDKYGINDISYQQKLQVIHNTSVDIDPPQSTMIEIETPIESHAELKVKNYHHTSLLGEFQRADTSTIVIDIGKWVKLGCLGVPRADWRDYDQSFSEQRALEQFIISMHPSEIDQLYDFGLPRSPSTLN